MWTILLIIFLASFAAFCLSAVCGGGAGLILIPILGKLLPISEVPAALSIGTFTSSASRLVVFRKYINWKIVKYFVPPALPAVWLGAYLLKYLDPVYLEIAMGVFLVSNLPLVFRKQKNSALSARPKNILLVTIGFLAGFLSGITGAVGLLFNRFYLRYGLSKEEIIATRAANEIILHLIKIILYVFFGLLSIKAMQVGLAVALSGVASAWGAKYLIKKMSEFGFRRIGYMAMVISGLIMLTQSTTGLLTANNGSLAANVTRQGLRAILKWQDANFSLEFTYDDGFEFAQIIPLSELSAEQQKLVYSKFPKADMVIVEEVYSVGKNVFEAEYYANNQFIGKYDFE